jgi:hypothetical protein
VHQEYVLQEYVLQEYVLQEYVHQEYVLESPTVCEREVGCSPVIREFEFVFSDRWKSLSKWSA